jgi:hypothetical protein
MGQRHGGGFKSLGRSGFRSRSDLPTSCNAPTALRSARGWLLALLAILSSLTLACDAELRSRFVSRHDDNGLDNKLFLRSFPCFTETGTMLTATIVKRRTLQAPQKICFAHIYLCFFSEETGEAQEPLLKIC